MNEIPRDPHADQQPPVPPQPSPPQQPRGPQAFPHPSPQAGGVQDDVWGVRPPALGQQGYGQGGYGQGGYGQGGYGPQPAGSATAGGPGASKIDRGLSALQKSPLRRDTSGGIVGGVAAGVAQRMNVSTAAVRIAAVALALFFGSGIAAYLIAWALLPDESGRTHVEQGVKGGNTQSLVISVLAGLAALGMVASVMDGLGWLVPVLVTAGIVGYVVHAGKKKGNGTTS